MEIVNHKSGACDLVSGGGDRASGAHPVDRHIEMIAVNQLKPYNVNARSHAKQQIDQIGASIKQFGFINPILVDAASHIIAGHGRVEAAKRLNLDFVPVLRVTHLSADERRAYALADNRLAELASWDDEILAIELQELRELDFDLAAIGFELDDVDIVGNAAEQTGRGQRTAPKTDRGASISGCAVSRAGDLWLLGGHQLQCGIAGDGSYAAIDAAIQRWQRVAGKSATLAGGNKSFAAIAKERASGAGQDGEA
jgi:ParB-like chromosome segregation protein Spo0J